MVVSKSWVIVLPVIVQPGQAVANRFSAIETNWSMLAHHPGSAAWSSLSAQVPLLLPTNPKLA